MNAAIDATIKVVRGRVAGAAAAGDTVADRASKVVMAFSCPVVFTDRTIGIGRRGQLMNESCPRFAVLWSLSRNW
jgi:hypothetical protein